MTFAACEITSSSCVIHIACVTFTLASESFTSHETCPDVCVCMCASSWEALVNQTGLVSGNISEHEHMQRSHMFTWRNARTDCPVHYVASFVCFIQVNVHTRLQGAVSSLHKKHVSYNILLHRFKCTKTVMLQIWKVYFVLSRMNSPFSLSNHGWSGLAGLLLHHAGEDTVITVSSFKVRGETLGEGGGYHDVTTIFIHRVINSTCMVPLSWTDSKFPPQRAQTKTSSVPSAEFPSHRHIWQLTVRSLWIFQVEYLLCSTSFYVTCLPMRFHPNIFTYILCIISRIPSNSHQPSTVLKSCHKEAKAANNTFAPPGAIFLTYLKKNPVKNRSNMCPQSETYIPLECLC